MNYQIITDSCCDFTDPQLAQMEVACVRLCLMWDGQCQGHFSTAPGLKDFYNRMRLGLTPSTSALNPADWAQVMEPYLQQGRDLLVLTVSSGISTTYQSAQIAAEELQERYPGQRIRVVDSLSGSLGEGLLLRMACRLRDRGDSLDSVCSQLEDNRHRLCHWVTVDDLCHLKRSGRLSGAGAILGTMLDIKPIIRVTDEGKLVSDGKVRGRKASIRALAERYARSCQLQEDTVAIAHGDCPEDAAALEKILREEYGVRDIITGCVGPVLGAHTGPGVLGLFHLGKGR